MTRLIIFARYPVAGVAKTRLIPKLGAERAAQLHRRMTENIVQVACSSCAEGQVTLYFTGASKRKFCAWLGDALDYKKQPGGDLGRRICQAFSEAFNSGVERVIVIGSDVPGITPAVIQQAEEALIEHDIVIGPAIDGGYYLLGLARPVPDLFTGIHWGTGSVLAQSLSIINNLGLSVKKLRTLHDVDRPSDLDHLRVDSRFADVINCEPHLSVIIPTLNESKNIAHTLENVGKDRAVEVIIVDGGSSDNTCAIAASKGAKVYSIRGGRAAQLNAGVERSSGRYLLFLHADTLPPPGYRQAIIGILTDPEVVGGAFRFSSDDNSFGMKLVALGTNLRSTILGLPYGDQGIFMERRIFDEMGGFKKLPIMEDFDLVCRLRKRGKVVTLRQPVITSSRRWQSLGTLRTTLRNQMMIAKFILGVSPQRLADFYRKNN